jgi:hypothetical protein
MIETKSETRFGVFYGFNESINQSINQSITPIRIFLPALVVAIVSNFKKKQAYFVDILLLKQLLGRGTV